MKYRYMIYNNTITILASQTQMLVVFHKKQPTVIKESSVVNCLMQSVSYFNYVINIILQLATYNYVYSFYTWLCSPQACNN